MCVLVDGLSAVSTASQDLAAKAAASKLELESETDAEDGQGEEKRRSLKSTNLRPNQVETKDDVRLVSTVKVGFHYPSSRTELTARELWCIF